jgi:hypothetical protein
MSKNKSYLHHVDPSARYHGRDDDNLIITSLVVDEPEYGTAVKLYADGLIVSGSSAEMYLDAEQAQALGTELMLWAVKLNQIAELRPHKAASKAKRR